MSIPSRISGGLHVDSLTCGSFTAPDGSIDDDAIQAGANIAPSKVESLRCIDVQLFAQATQVSTVAQILHTVRGTSGSLVGFQAVQYTTGSSTAAIISIDLQKCTTSSTWATVLSAPLTLASSDAAFVPRSATINTAGILSGNILRVVVATTGTSTNMTFGLTAHLHYSETYS